MFDWNSIKYHAYKDTLSVRPCQDLLTTPLPDMARNARSFMLANNEQENLMTESQGQGWDQRHQKTIVEVQMVWEERASFLAMSAVLTSWVESLASVAIADVNPSKPAAAGGLIHGALGENDEDEGDDDDEHFRADLKSGGQETNGERVLNWCDFSVNFKRQAEEKKE